MNLVLADEISFLVPAKLDACSIIRERVTEIAVKLPISDRDLDEIRIAVGEAASNAIKHGCKDRPCAEVSVRCWSDCDELGIEIADDGPGFDPERVADPVFSDFPEGGMGIFCMRHAMDAVSFSFDTGTKVTLIKRLKPNTD